MLMLTLDWGDYQFVKDQTSVSKEINPEGTNIDLKLFASRKVSVLLKQKDGDTLHWMEGETLEARTSVYGFHEIAIHCTKSTDFAVRLLLGLNLEEVNSGEPVVLLPTEDEMRFERTVQHAIIRDLAAHGADQELIEDLLTGLNSNEDLEFDDEVELPSEAEMNELIDQARLRAAEEAADGDNEAEGGGDPKVSEPPSAASTEPRETNSDEQ